MPDTRTETVNARLPDDLNNLAGSVAPQVTDAFRLRVLRLLLAISSIAIATIWYLETQSGLIGAIDRVAYPVLLVTDGLGTLLLFLRPQLLQRIVATIFTTFILYLLANYYYLFIYQTVTGHTSNYQLATLALWLPLGYLAAFIFFSPRTAGLTSLGIFAAFCLPQLAILSRIEPLIAHDMIINMLLSHVVYITALWGVAQIKSHAAGVHNIAQTMRLAATQDSLTGVPNRRVMRQALEAVIADPLNHVQPVSLLLFDVDRFKNINDTHGHDVGDEVLVRIAHFVQRQLRTTDLLARWGGEEFIILVPGQSEEQARQTAERLRAGLADIEHPHVGTVTASVGFTRFVPGESVSAFVKRADGALYQAKRLGRNRVEGQLPPQPATDTPASGK
jgi:diguanylate cyclase (GGDEF)-like protein